MTGFYPFSPAIVHACHLVLPSNRSEDEISEAIDLLIPSGRTIDAIGVEGWRVDVGYPEDRDRAEALLQGEKSVAVEDSAVGLAVLSPILTEQSAPCYDHERGLRVAGVVTRKGV